MRTIGLKPGDRVLVMQQRDDRQLVIDALVIGISMEPLLAGKNGEMSIDAVFVPPEEWQTEMRFVSMARIVHISHVGWQTGQQGFAYEELPPQSGVCMFCGCTELRPCVDGNGDACGWMDAGRTVCSAFHCLEKLGEEMKHLGVLEL